MGTVRGGELRAVARQGHCATAAQEAIVALAARSPRSSATSVPSVSRLLAVCRGLCISCRWARRRNGVVLSACLELEEDQLHVEVEGEGRDDAAAAGSSKSQGSGVAAFVRTGAVACVVERGRRKRDALQGAGAGREDRCREVEPSDQRHLEVPILQARHGAKQRVDVQMCNVQSRKRSLNTRKSTPMNYS